MKSLILFLLSVLMLSASAQEAEQLAKQKSCMGCHSVDKHTSVVPSFQKVAEKYKEDPDALRYIEDKIASGSKGVWSGSAKGMPAYPTLTRAELKTLAQWIMGTP